MCSFSSSVGALKALILTPADQPSRSRAGSLRPYRGVHPLQDHQDLLCVCFRHPAAGVEPLLQITQFWVRAPGSMPVRRPSCPEAGSSFGVREPRSTEPTGSRSSSVNGWVIAAGSAGSTSAHPFLLGAMGRILHYPRRGWRKDMAGLWLCGCSMTDPTRRYR